MVLTKPYQERDTSRAIMDSWEKELTVSGSSWEQSRIEALEKTLDEYKAALPDSAEFCFLAQF